MREPMLLAVRLGGGPQAVQVVHLDRVRYPGHVHNQAGARVQAVDEFDGFGKVVAAVNETHPVELPQLHMVAFGIDDQDAVTRLYPLLGHQAHQIALARSGRTGDEDAALTSRNLRR